MDRPWGVVLVTVPSQTEAQAIARALVTDRLVACVTLFPVTSIYPWQGEIQEEEEWQLLIKTDLDHFPTLVERMQALHSYDVPEILALPLVAGSQSYLQWLAETVAPLDSSP